MGSKRFLVFLPGVMMTPELWRRVRKRAIDEDRHAADLVEEAARTYLDQAERPHPEAER